MSRKFKQTQQFDVIKIVKTARGWGKQVPFCSQTTAKSALGRISLAQNGTYILASKFGGEVRLTPKKAYAFFQKIDSKVKFAEAA